MLQPGPSNSLHDVAGLSVGSAHDARAITGVTAVFFEEAAVCAAAQLGGGPASAETDLLRLENTVGRVHGLVLSGGSVFGLEAGAALRRELAAQGVGYAIGPARAPIIPQACLFDLLNGGDKESADYGALARAALGAAGEPILCGSYGAGFGAATADARGGLGTASLMMEDGTAVAALVAVNALGSALIGATGRFWAAPLERGGEFGGLGSPERLRPEDLALKLKGGRLEAARANTTLAIVATDAALDRMQAARLAIMANDGLAMALRPAHAPLDGDCVFAAATGRRPLPAPMLSSLTRLGAAAAETLARAAARAVYAAAPVPPGAAMPPAWREIFAS